MTIIGRPTLRRFADQKQIEAEVAEEVKNLQGKPNGIVRIVEPRCRVCQQEESRTLVNRMLADAMTYPQIVEMVNLAINPMRAKNAKITYDSVWHHARKHFNLEEPAKAVYRSMLERRAAEQEQVARQGITHLVTALGYLDVMAQKGYETLIKEDTYISPTVGMEAVVRLHNMTRKQAGEQEAAELKARLAVVESAVKEVVPPEYWNAIIERIEDGEARITARPVVDAEVVDDYDDYEGDEPWSPPVEADIDDSLEG